VTESWRQPRRILMAALGGLTVFYLLAPTLVIVPMSFTEAEILSFPPQGFSLQWYEHMLTDTQWSTSIVTVAYSWRVKNLGRKGVAVFWAVASAALA